MKLSFLRSIPLVAAALLATSSSANAATQDKMDCVYTESPIGTCGAKLPLGRPEVEGCGCSRWMITADVLYWYTKLGGTEFAYTDQDHFGDLPIRGRVKDVGFGSDWGLRFGVGYNFDHDFWTMNAQYTYYSNNTSESTTAGQNSSVIPLRGWDSLTDNDDVRAVGSAKTQFDLDFQSVDLELSRSYYITPMIAFRTHFGLKAAWIDLDQHIRYNGGDSLGANTIHIQDDSDFK